jgi:ribosomal protein S18 acetylase RimI-like enzyme
MWAPLDELDLDGGRALPEGAELDEAPPWSVIGDVNDAAYGLPPDHLAAVMRGADPGLAHRAAAVVDGRPVAVAVVNRVGEDAHVLMVATLKDFRGRGLASACMRSGLRRAAADGATTTTLEATGVGAPVYARMGYRPLGALQMWERRVS